MANFKVVFEIEVDANNPLAAAKEAQKWLRNDDWQYYVQNCKTHEVFSVDLQEEDEDAVLPVKEYHPIIKELYE
jgi:hypothetical protein